MLSVSKEWIGRNNYRTKSREKNRNEENWNDLPWIHKENSRNWLLLINTAILQLVFELSLEYHFTSLLIHACTICWSTSASMIITELWWCTMYHRPSWNSKTLVTLNGPLSISTTYVFMVTQAMSVSTRALTSRTCKSNPCSQLNANCQLCITALYLYRSSTSQL
jgi:hypothetical protein